MSFQVVGSIMYALLRVVENIIRTQSETRKEFQAFPRTLRNDATTTCRVQIASLVCRAISSITWETKRTSSVGRAGPDGDGLKTLQRDVSAGRGAWKRGNRSRSLGYSAFQSAMDSAVEIGPYRLLTTLGIGAFGKVKRESPGNAMRPSVHLRRLIARR